MKKRGFLSIYLLIILTLLSISLAFIYEQAKNNNNLNKDLYDRKKAIYELESVYNIVFDDKKSLIESLEDINKKNDNSWHEYEIEYFGKKEKVKIQKQKDDDFVLRGIKIIGNSRADLVVSLELKEKYKIKEDKKIILSDKFDEFFENLKFKDKKFEEYDNYQIKKDYNNAFLKIKKDLKVKAENKKIKSNESSNKDFLEKNSNLSNEKKDFFNKTKTARRISGIVIVGKDLILENDFILDGLLIIKGDIISKNNSKLTINGQLISQNDYNDIVNYKFEKNRSYDYINDIENPKYIEIKSKKVF